MKAAIIKGPKNLVIEEVEKPTCAPNGILIKVHKASICNATDVHIWEGNYDPRLHLPYPHILGHESSGEIVEVGSEVKEFKIGDRVANWCKMEGAFAEYNHIIPEELAVVKINPNLSYEEGSLLEVVAGTMRTIYHSEIRPADKVAVLGQGPTGLVLLQEAKLFGASLVIGFDLYDFRLEKSKELGADLTFNPKKISVDEITKKVVKEVGELDLIIDTISSRGAMNLGVSLLKKGGRYVLFGFPMEDQKVTTRLLAIKDVHLKGAPSLPMEKTRELLKLGEKLVSEGKLKLKPLITHHLPLERVEEGLTLCKEYPQKTLKVIIDII